MRTPIVNTQDKRKGIVASLLALTMLVIYLLFVTIEMADPPPKDEVVLAKLSMPEELSLENLQLDGAPGGGKASDAPKNVEPAQTEQVITKKDNPDTHVNTGESLNTNSPNSDNPAPNPEPSTDPFAAGGDGDANTGGSGNKLGSDTGSGEKGTHGGSGGGKGRIRKTDPVFDDLHSDVTVVIHLKLTIDEKGNVVSAQSIKSLTKTNNQVLINKVIDTVKKQVKYNEAPGSGLNKVYITVQINAT